MGKLIVFEGTDGSGKSTQFNRVCDWLRSQNIDFKSIHFPQYDQMSSIPVRMYLWGDFGTNPDDVNPYAASTFYAVDRFASYRQHWEKYYNGGGLILTDRYTTSNAVCQGAKIQDLTERQNYFKWLYDLEFHKIRIPKPDHVVLIDTPAQLCEGLLQHREDSGQGQKDIHESNLQYIEHCRESALAAAEFFSWDIIHTAKDNQLQPVDVIFQDVMKLIKSYI